MPRSALTSTSDTPRTIVRPIKKVAKKVAPVVGTIAKTATPIVATVGGGAVGGPRFARTQEPVRPRRDVIDDR